jgi:carbon monoxide dehydrogenase subunit G
MMQRMARYQTEIDSTLSVGDAFRYMAEFQNVEHWDPGVKSAEKLDDGPARLGTQFRVLTVTNGREIPIVYRISEIDDDSRVVLTGETPRLISQDEITVREKGDGSLVTYTANLKLRGALSVLNPFLGGTLKKIGDRARDQLRTSLNPA